MHVAVLDEEFPFPLNSGKRIRTFNLLTRLAREHRITYVAYRNSSDEETRCAAKALRDHGIFPRVVEDRVPGKSGPGLYLRLIRNLFSPLPYSVASHDRPSFRSAVDRLEQTDRPDLWHCEWSPYAQAMHGRAGRWVVMAHNVESLIWERYAEHEKNPLKHWFLHKQWKRFEQFEAWAYRAATRVVAVSDEDAARMQRLFGVEHPSVVENGVDTAFFRPDGTVPRDPLQMLFLGSLDWRPNLDGVQILLDAILPRVRAIEPRATLAIVGRNPPEALRSAVLGREGVELHANVPDVRPYLHRAGQLVVPLRIGGGSRLKILEALSAGTPVVTTKIGVEGLRLRDGDHCTVADGAEAFAQAVLDGMKHPKVAELRAAMGRTRVLAEYDWSGLASRLNDVWHAAVDG